MLPSLVWFSPKGPVVGEAARAGLDHSPDLTIFGAKRLLGRRFDHPEIKKLARILPYELIEAPNGDTWIALSARPRGVARGGLRADPARAARASPSAHFGEPVTRAVITIPAWYDAAQRQATKDAAAIAGLTVMRLLSEPTAAALGHGAHRGADRRYLVCDLGGGTFDVAAVDVEARHLRGARDDRRSVPRRRRRRSRDRREPRARRPRVARPRHLDRRDRDRAPAARRAAREARAVAASRREDRTSPSSRSCRRARPSSTRGRCAATSSSCGPRRSSAGSRRRCARRCARCGRRARGRRRGAARRRHDAHAGGAPRARARSSAASRA